MEHFASASQIVTKDSICMSTMFHTQMEKGKGRVLFTTFLFSFRYRNLVLRSDTVANNNTTAKLNVSMEEERVILCKENVVGQLSPAERMWKDRDFTDVTLVSGDHMKIEAHKVVLASSSNFFRDILKENPHPKPLLFMKDFHHRHLKMALEFIYKGECAVFKDDLKEFLETAKELEIEGVAEKDFFEALDDEEATYEEWDNAVELSENIVVERFEERNAIEEERKEDTGKYLWGRPLSRLFNDKPMTQKESSAQFSCDEKSSAQFSCDECDYESWNIFLLKNHKMVKHEDNDQPWDHNNSNCSMCPKIKHEP